MENQFLPATASVLSGELEQPALLQCPGCGAILGTAATAIARIVAWQYDYPNDRDGITIMHAGLTRWYYCPWCGWETDRPIEIRAGEGGRV